MIACKGAKKICHIIAKYCIKNMDICMTFAIPFIFS